MHLSWLSEARTKVLAWAAGLVLSSCCVELPAEMQVSKQISMWQSMVAISFG